MMALPIFLSRPDLVVGMPVLRAKFWRAWVMPKARFHENESPGIPVFVFLFAILFFVFLFCRRALVCEWGSALRRGSVIRLVVLPRLGVAQRWQVF